MLALVSPKKETPINSSTRQNMGVSRITVRHQMHCDSSQNSRNSSSLVFKIFDMRRGFMGMPSASFWSSRSNRTANLALHVEPDANFDNQAPPDCLRTDRSTRVRSAMTRTAPCFASQRNRAVFSSRSVLRK
jgi:hypothetical protein